MQLAQIHSVFGMHLGNKYMNEIDGLGSIKRLLLIYSSSKSPNDSDKSIG